jgi:hypothetical protein
VKTIAAQDVVHSHFPDYAVTMSDDMVYFANRRVDKAEPRKKIAHTAESNPVITEQGLLRARAAAPRYDIHGLYQEWVAWWHDSGSPELMSADAAFISFCRKRYERAPI